MRLGCGIRFVAATVVFSTLLSTRLNAADSGLGGTSSALAALQTKAEQAQPRDKCFLYAKLVSQMTDLAGRQLQSGDSAQAAQTLMLVAQYAATVRTDIAEDSKKLKDAEVLMQRTAYRLKDILNEASYEDRQGLEATLEQLNQVQAQLMSEVFRH